VSGMGSPGPERRNAVFHDDGSGVRGSWVQMGCFCGYGARKLGEA
jgi:hypothetical protein